MKVSPWRMFLIKKRWACHRWSRLLAAGQPSSKTMKSRVNFLVMMDTLLPMPEIRTISPSKWSEFYAIKKKRRPLSINNRRSFQDIIGRRTPSACSVLSMKRLGNKIFLYPAIFTIFFALALALFLSPLFDNAGALQWDAREVHLTNLIFSSSSWHDGFWPLWSPYIFSGFPQIADLQVAIFYPINLVVGLFAVFSQKIIFWQLALHYALAGFGMFLLARYLNQNTLIGIFAGIAYMFSGFMIGHSSHLGMQNTAAWLPIVFFLAIRALDKCSWRGAIFAGTAVGVMILAGHFQMAVFALFALGLHLIFNLFISMYPRIWRGRVSNNENAKQFSNSKPKTNSDGDS